MYVKLSSKVGIFREEEIIGEVFMWLFNPINFNLKND